MTYTPPGSRSTAAILALYVKVGACLLAIGADVRRIVVAQDLKNGDVLVDRLLGADQLVAAATLFELAVLVVAVFLVVRWFLVVRGNRPVLGALMPRPAVVTACLVAVAVAVVAVVVTWTVFGDARDAGERQRIDALRAGATALSALATGLAIAAVSSVTARQEARAVEVGAPRGPAAGGSGDETVSEGGLRVVSEARARTDRGAQ